MRSKELSAKFRDRIVWKHRSGEGYQKMSAALKVPKNTVPSIILKWKNFRTTKTVPRAGRTAKLIKQGRKALVREVTKNLMVREVTKHLMVTLTELHSYSVEMREPSSSTTISAALHQPGLYGRMARHKPLLSKRHMTTCLEFAKRHLKDSKTMKNKIHCSDETKLALFS